MDDTANRQRRTRDVRATPENRFTYLRDEGSRSPDEGGRTVTDERGRTGRRRMLKVLGASALASSLAGCSGGSDDGGDGDDGSDDQSADDGTDDGQNGDDGQDGDDGTGDGTGDGDDGSGDGDDGGSASEPGGDASFVGSIQTQERQHDVWDEFESLTVTLERIVFQEEGGDSVEFGVGSDVDLGSMEPGESQTYVDDAAFPSGNYTTVELYMPVQEATMADGSEPSKEFRGFEPVEVSLDSFDDYMTVESGATLDLTVSLILLETYDEEGWQFSVGWARSY